MDIPSLRQRYYEMVHTLQAYQLAINEAAIVSVTDLTGRIIFVNGKFTEISGYTEEELLGSTHSIVNSGHHPKAFFTSMWQQIASGSHWRGEIRNKAKDGSFYWVDTVITPVMDQHGKIFQYLSIRNVITRQKEDEAKLLAVQKELASREQQLKAAQHVSKTGSWYLSIPDNRIEWSEESYHIFGIAPGTPMNYATFLERVHPDDREMVETVWQRGIQDGSYNIAHRIITPNGIKWVRERAEFEYADGQRPAISAIGTVQDITDKKTMEASLIESEELYRSLFNRSPFAIGIVEKSTMRFLEVNDTAQRLYNYSREEFLQLTAYDIRLKEEHQQLRAQLKGGQYAQDNSIRTHVKKNGEKILVEPTVTEITYGKKPAYLITIVDKTDKLRTEEELQRSKLLRNKAILDAQEMSRAEIGRELHDNINQLLVAAGLYFKAVETLNDKDKQLIETGTSILGSANEEIRKLSSALVSPVTHDQSLQEGIGYFQHSLALSGIRLLSEVRINEQELSQGLKINIYRIVQEQVNNIVKYAEATEVRILLHRLPDSLSLIIGDNGRGFDTALKSKGIGFANMNYRAEAYEGTLRVESAPGHGCRVIVKFRLPGKAES